MTGRIAGLFLVVCLASFSLLSPFISSAQDAKQAADEKDGCERNLKTIYAAIQAYRADHKDIPRWLSDLVPQYISDANVLICPVCERTGQTEGGVLADPKLPCSYLYEFCPMPLGTNDTPGGRMISRREWKRRQMGIVGSIVPIVRCRHHGKTLNLAFDGRIYESPVSWEDLVTNVVNVADLSPMRLFATEQKGPGKGAKADRRKISIPRRDPSAGPNLINLATYYNASLTESWHGNAQDNSLSSLPEGVQNLAGVDFDVRGIIQLGSKSNSAKHFPMRINRIKVQRKCARLHFLHAAAFGTTADEGEEIGSYIVHFATNQMQLEIPIVYGRDVRNWHSFADEKPSATLNVAWTGANEVSEASHRSIRLFATTWVNVAPEVSIVSIDFVSAQETPAPFLIAITAE